MTIELKIKAMSLAAEARAIRVNEKRLARKARKARAARLNSDVCEATRAAIYHHRVNVVRPEARATHLARAFLNGVAAQRLEDGARTRPDFARVASIAKRHGLIRVTSAEVADWYDKRPEAVPAKPVVDAASEGASA